MGDTGKVSGRQESQTVRAALVLRRKLLGLARPGCARLIERADRTAESSLTNGVPSPDISVPRKLKSELGERRPRQGSYPTMEKLLTCRPLSLASLTLGWW